MNQELKKVETLAKKILSRHLRLGELQEQDDLIQDILIKYWNNKWNPQKATWNTWVHFITLKTYLSWRRSIVSHRKNCNYIPLEEVTELLSYNIDDDLYKKEIYHKIYQKLNKSDQKLFKRWLEGYTQEELCKIYNYKYRSSACRMIKELKSKIADSCEVYLTERASNV